MILALILSIAGIIISSSVCFIVGQKKESVLYPSSKYLAVAIIFSLLCAAIFFGPAVYDFSNDIGSNSHIHSFSDAALYLDIETGEYYIIKNNLWNVFNPCERYTVDQTRAKELADTIAEAEAVLDTLAKQQILGEPSY